MASLPGGYPTSDCERGYAEWLKVSASLGRFNAESGQDEPDLFLHLCSFIGGHAAERGELRAPA